MHALISVSAGDEIYESKRPCAGDCFDVLLIVELVRVNSQIALLSSGLLVICSGVAPIDKFVDFWPSN
jgi:hypothetical protein